MKLNVFALPLFSSQKIYRHYIVLVIIVRRRGYVYADCIVWVSNGVH